MSISQEKWSTVSTHESSDGIVHYERNESGVWRVTLAARAADRDVIGGVAPESSRSVIG